QHGPGAGPVGRYQTTAWPSRRTAPAIAVRPASWTSRSAAPVAVTIAVSDAWPGGRPARTARSYDTSPVTVSAVSTWAAGARGTRTTGGSPATPASARAIW